MSTQTSESSGKTALNVGLAVLFMSTAAIGWGFYQISDFNEGSVHPWGFAVFVSGLVGFLIGFVILLVRSGFGLLDWTRPH